MNVVRFSAVKSFGVPIESPDHTSSTKKLIALMRSYSAEELDISSEITDITPYYWENTVFRYYLSRRGEEGPAVIELVPRHHDSQAHAISSIAPGLAIGTEFETRTIVVPTAQEAMAIGGPGPRYAGQVCVHELIAQV